MNNVLGRTPLTEAEAFNNFIEAVRLAEASAKQLAHLKQQKQWLRVEFMLSHTRNLAIALATTGLRV